MVVATFGNDRGTHDAGCTDGTRGNWTAAAVPVWRGRIGEATAHGGNMMHIVAGVIVVAAVASSRLSRSVRGVPKNFNNKSG
jgi:hypothetical protein